MRRVLIRLFRLWVGGLWHCAVQACLHHQQAFQLYRAKLATNGLMLINISNRYLRLEPVLAALAEDAGLAGLECHDDDPSDIPGKTASSWVVLAERTEGLPRLPAHWRRLANTPGTSLWTDDFSNLLGTIIWRN